MNDNREKLGGLWGRQGWLGSEESELSETIPHKVNILQTNAGILGDLLNAWFSTGFHFSVDINPPEVKEKE